MTSGTELRSLNDWRGVAMRVGSHVLYPRWVAGTVEVVEGAVEQILLTGSRKRTTYHADTATWETDDVPTYAVHVRPLSSSRHIVNRATAHTLGSVVIKIHENLTVLP